MLEPLPLKVIYVMGVGHSGSTLLDICLGSHAESVSVGELFYLPSKGWFGKQTCACGKRGNECAFWLDVRADWFEQVGSDYLGRYVFLQNRFERFRGWLKLRREKYRYTPEFNEYSRATEALYNSIRRVSGKRIIVDSSKNPARALALSLNPGLDVRSYLRKTMSVKEGELKSRKSVPVVFSSMN